MANISQIDTYFGMLIDSMAVYVYQSCTSRLLTHGWLLMNPPIGLSRKDVLRDIIIDVCASKPQPDLRRIFKDLAVETTLKQASDKNHTHLAATQLRCNANTSIRAFADMIGKEVFSVSQSKTERDAGDNGTRSYFVEKDLIMESNHNDDFSNSLVKLTDVDYYTEPSKYLLGNHMCIYTFSPKSVAGTTSDGDGTYWVDENNYVHTVINGGAQYCHRIWDFEDDHVVVKSKLGLVSWLYLIEKKQLSEDRVIIHFNPIRRVCFPGNLFVKGQTFAPKSYYEGNGFVSNIYRNTTPDSNSTSNIKLSIARVGSYHSVDLSYDHYLACFLRENASKQPNMGNIERILNQYELKDTTLKAALLHTYIASGPKLEKKILTSGLTPAEPKFQHYQCLTPYVLDDGDDNIRPVGPCLAKGATAPARSVNNDHACIQGRLKDVENPIQHYPPFVYQCLSEFVHSIIPNKIAHTLVPLDFDAQWDQFQRPAQRSKIIQSMSALFTNKLKIKSFQKAETYAKYTAPRNISTLPMEHNFPLGQFSMALSEHLKTFEWYAFGKHPSEFTARLQNLAAEFQKLNITDISKCDGSIGYIHYLLTLTLCLRAFKKEYSNEIVQLLYKESVASGSTNKRVPYKQKFTTLSGSSDTSWRNTVINAFNDYVGLRKTLTAAQAFKRLGLYGGDDGISTNQLSHLVNETYAQLGMKIKAIQCVIGEPVPFLGRIYVDPWTTNESFSDVKRHIVKLHLTGTSKDVPDHIVLRRKAEGFKITDPTTPFISHWVNCVLRVVPAISTREATKFENLTRNDLNYYARKFKEPFTPVASISTVTAIICQDLECTSAELQDLCKALDDIRTYDEFLAMKPYFDFAPPVDVNVQLGHDILTAKPKITQSEEVAEIAKKAKTYPVEKNRNTKIQRKIENIVLKVHPPAIMNTRPTASTNQPHRSAQKPNIVCKFVAQGKKCPHKSCRFNHKRVQ